MSSQNKPYLAYTKANETLSDSRQILKLYDGSINCLKQAQAAHEQGNIEERYNLLAKVAEIIGGLQGCLNFEQGGEVAKALFSYYTIVETHIMAVLQRPTSEAFPLIIEEVTQMRDIWELIDREHGSDIQKSKIIEDNQESQIKIPMCNDLF